MATSCPAMDRCNTKFPGWLNGDHPAVHDGKVSRQICFNQNGCCKGKNYIFVKNCNSYFLYQLKPVQVCHRRYCYTDTTGSQAQFPIEEYVANDND